MPFIGFSRLPESFKLAYSKPHPIFRSLGELSMTFCYPLFPSWLGGSKQISLNFISKGSSPIVGMIGFYMWRRWAWRANSLRKRAFSPSII
ncbi:hypothetical protein SCLCIDRAFT_1134138 [Scleroderma citrinum Foug A]|uniref:Uncharacterized protein n=1 Tax=Scleroderma citrinum Foug A TaxID=1036808 RepID=A0A0C3DM99_9AGAM|nr:hypothetical protein SCLCIDRAFT_1134138 [Scleroderma citrinum Foug A]